jgi:protein TonB
MTTILLLLSLVLAPQPQAPIPIRPGGNIPYPARIKDVKPVYPREAQQAHATGMVIIEATIDEDGHVRDAIIKRSIPLLDQAALDAVRQWIFMPTIVGGKPVPVIMTVTVNFALEDSTPPLPPPFSPMIRLTAFRVLDTMSVWEITPALAARMPRWNLDASLPPLPIAQAMRMAREWVAERNPQAERLELQNLVLSRLRRGPEIDFWFYQIDFFATGTTPPGLIFKAVILPDGSFVEPRTEPARP